MVKKIMFGNFKGGVGKTTNSIMTAYELAKKGYSVLVCDLDPQSNSTQLLSRTYYLQNDEPLTIEKQENYFATVVAGLFEIEKPNQLLFSFFLGSKHTEKRKKNQKERERERERK